MANLSEWREIVKKSLVSKVNLNWSCDALENIFLHYINLCVKKNFLENSEVICTTLSGGVDSSLCLALIREVTKHEVVIHTFTTGINEKCPDVQFARAMAQKFKTEHHELFPSQDDIEIVQEKIKLNWFDEIGSLGDVAVFLTYENIQRHNFKSVIVHDGIDELMGGYWEHRRHENVFDQENAFRMLWSDLPENHLLALERKAKHFGIKVLLPYLQNGIVDYVSKIPVWHRTNREESKIPLKMIARKFLPLEVVDRKKTGFCDALRKVEEE